MTKEQAFNLAAKLEVISGCKYCVIKIEDEYSIISSWELEKQI